MTLLRSTRRRSVPLVNKTPSLNCTTPLSHLQRFQPSTYSTQMLYVTSPKPPLPVRLVLLLWACAAGAPHCSDEDGAYMSSEGSQRDSLMGDAGSVPYEYPPTNVTRPVMYDAHGHASSMMLVDRGRFPESTGAASSHAHLRPPFEPTRYLESSHHSMVSSADGVPYDAERGEGEGRIARWRTA